MYLKEDELDAEVLSGLKRHRLECAACAAEYASVELSRRVTAVLKEQTPEMSDSLLFTNSVIGLIENEVMKSQAGKSSSAFDRFVILLSAPRLRWVMAGMLFFIVGSFAFEYTSAFVTMKQFEENVDKKTLSHEDAAVTIMSQKNLLNAVEDLSKLISGEQLFVEVSDNWVMINKNSLEKFFLLYSELKENDSILSKEFREANPSISRLLETKIQATQLDILLKERESLINEFNRLIPKERKQP